MLSLFHQGGENHSWKNSSSLIMSGLEGKHGGNIQSQVKS